MFLPSFLYDDFCLSRDQTAHLCTMIDSVVSMYEENKNKSMENSTLNGHLNEIQGPNLGHDCIRALITIRFWLTTGLKLITRNQSQLQLDHWSAVHKCTAVGFSIPSYVCILDKPSSNSEKLHHRYLSIYISLCCFLV